MLDKKISTRHKELSKLLKIYADKYYNDDSPIISDYEYDKLYKELLQMEETYPELINQQSISQQIGGKASDKFTKITHLAPMLSIQNAYTISDVEDFYKRSIQNLENKLNININKNKFEIYAEPKIDGLSCSLTYQNGEFLKAATRGNGIIGEDVTQNVLTIQNIPLNLNTNNPPKLIEIRGEVYMQKPDFNNLNDARKKNGEELFANPRNAAAGSLRQLNHLITKTRNLKFYAYSVYSNDKTFNTQLEISTMLSDWGFATNPLNKLIDNLQDLKDYYEKLENTRSSLLYDIDGVVYKINNLQWQTHLGAASKYPRHTIAHKFTAETGVTYIKNIFLSIGRTGIITPVAIMDPVNIGGVTITKATLHNKNEIIKKDIRIGDKVLIQRAGDVIPQIISSFKDFRNNGSQPFQFPLNCPYCNCKLFSDQTFIKCTNHHQCPPQIIERLAHFCSRDALNIEGLAIKNIEFFVKQNIIKSPVDIFKLEEKIDKKELDNMEGWGEVSINNLINSINNSRTPELSKFIFALGINHVGKTTAKILAKKFKTFDDFFLFVKSDLGDSKLSSIDGIGPIISDEIRSFFENENNKEIAMELNKILTIKNTFEIPEQKENFFTDKSIVITGTFSAFKRSRIQEILEYYGGIVLNSVSKKLDILIVGENPGSKLVKAQELNIHIINEEHLLQLLKDHNS